MKTYTDEEIRQMLASLQGLPLEVEVSSWDVNIWDQAVQRIANVWTHGDEAQGEVTRESAIRFAEFFAAAEPIIRQLLERVETLERELASARTYTEIVKSAAEQEMNTLRAELAAAHETIAMIGGQAK